MKEFKGTKGEWVVDHYPTPLNQMMQANFSVRVNDGVKTPICKLPCSTSEKQSEHLISAQEANAQLIASAPELLEALQGMLERFDYREQSTYSFASKEIDAAKAAIKKAIE